MRVVHVAPTPFGADGIFGGGERYPLELARALAAHVDCELVTFARKPGLVRGPNGLRLRTLRPLTYLGHPAHPIAAGLPRALRTADIIHTHHMTSTPSRIAAVIGRLRRKRAVVTDHGLAGSQWGGLLPRFFDGFLAVSEHSARQMATPRSRTRVIYGGVDCERYTPDSSGTRRGVVFIGRLTPHKGIDRLIRALPRGASLTIAGSAGHDPRLPERDYPKLLRRLAERRDVRFVGPVPDADLPTLLRGAAVLALPSVHWTCYGRYVPVSELLGLVVLEAMASGTPVVCSRIGGLPEIVEEGVTGFLVEPGDVDELRDRLAQVLGDPQGTARVGREARERALERFTWSHCAERCLAAYEDLGGSDWSQATSPR